MSMLHFILLVALALIDASTSRAVSDVKPIPGWSLAQTGRGLVMNTPCSAGPTSIIYAIYPASSFGQMRAEEWLGARTQSIVSTWAANASDIVVKTPVKSNGLLLFQTMEFRDRAGNDWSAVMMGSTNPKGQLYSVVAPKTVPDDSPQLIAALDHAITLISEDFTLDPNAFRATDLPDPGGKDGAGPIVAMLHGQHVRTIFFGQLDTEPDRFVLTQSGRFFLDHVDDATVEGTWKKVGSAYELTHGDGMIDLVSETCGVDTVATQPPPVPAPAGSPSVQAAKPAASVTLTNPAAPQSAGGNCRKVMKEVFSQQMVTQCDAKGRCTMVPVSSTRLQEDEVCD
jgi:hypothetical protein